MRRSGTAPSTWIDRSTYRRVRYWVSQATFQPLKAEFFSVSDRLLKTCDYCY